MKSERGLRAYLGTSGFSYPEWKGAFYPEKLPNKEMLRHYSSRLPSVEINNTFYRMPRREVLADWASQTPDGFRFAVKASRRLTHFKKLRDPQELLQYLIQGLAVLEQRRGPVLFQLPPTMKADPKLLADFLQVAWAVHDELCPGAEHQMLPAFEFRHPSWFCDEIYEVLSAQRAALVSGDLDESTKDPPLVRTAEFAYLRLRKTEYAPGDLDLWAARLTELNVSEVFAYFKHEELGPHLALQLQSLLLG